ncbi:hypothetical protein LguiA_023510 [Lonicera macranthoides]
MTVYSSTYPSHFLSCSSFAGVHTGNLISGELRSRKLSWSSCVNSRAWLQVANPPHKLSLGSSPMLSPMAIGSNVSEDTDDMYDDLIKKYGKVVYKSNDQKSPVAEVDDDAESLSFAVAVAKIASDVKAADIRVLFVKPLVYWTRFFIISTAFSRPQINAIQSKIRDLAEEQYGKFATGDLKPNSWTLLDFGDVVVHIFLPEQRALYNLEEFYANAPLIDLPFENQPPFRG